MIGGYQEHIIYQRAVGKLYAPVDTQIGYWAHGSRKS